MDMDRRDNPNLCLLEMTKLQGVVVALGGVCKVCVLRTPVTEGLLKGSLAPKGPSGNIWSYAFETPLYFLKKMIQSSSYRQDRTHLW